MSFKESAMQAANTACKFMYDNYPKITMAVGTTAVLVGLVFTAKAAPKWLARRDEFREKLDILHSTKESCDTPESKADYAKNIAREYGAYHGSTLRIFSLGLGLTLTGLGLMWFGFGSECAKEAAAVAAALSTADQFSKYRVCVISEQGCEADERYADGMVNVEDEEGKHTVLVTDILSPRCPDYEDLVISVRNDIPWDGRTESDMIDFLQIKRASLATKLKTRGNVTVTDVARALGVRESRISHMGVAGRSMGVCLTNDTRYSGPTNIDFHCGINGFDEWKLEEFRRGADLLIDIRPVFIDPFLGTVFHGCTGTVQTA